MADHSFGWLCGTHYAAHVSDQDNAAFAAVLVMPWASITDKWTQAPHETPALMQEECERDLGDWLAPWEGKVTWQLYALAGDAIRLVGNARKVAPNILAADAAAIKQRASVRLHAHVKGSKHAMGFDPEEDGRILTYPIVGGGLSQIPAPLSDGVLCSSCILEVARSELKAGESVVALPTLTAGGATIGPKPSGHQQAADPKATEFWYSGGSVRTVAGNDYTFRSCVSITVPDHEFGGSGGTYAPRRVEIRNGRATRQVYATLSREFYPLRLWVSVMNEMRVAALGLDTFRGMLAQFVGSGEDELDTNGEALGSIYQLVLPETDYRALITPLRTAGVSPEQRLLTLFRSFTATPANVKHLLRAFAQGAERLGLEDTKLAAVSLASLPDPTLAADENIRTALARARALAAALQAPEPSARALWACWLAAVLANVAPTAFAGNAPYANAAGDAANRLVTLAQVALRDERAATPPVLEDDVLRLMNGQIDYAPTFWKQVHAAADPASGLEQPAEQSQLLDSIEKRGWALAGAETAKLMADMKQAYLEALDRIRTLLQDDAAEGDDPPLQLRYAAPVGIEEDAIRGCVLAIRTGTPEPGNNVAWLEPQWISTFEADDPDTDTRIHDDAGVALFIDTHGATNADGLPEQEAVYDGQPLFAAETLEKATVDRGALLLRQEPPAKAPPPLAFGFLYEAICGTVDNAGVILETDLRDGQYDGVPQLGEAWFNALAKDAGGNPIPAFRLLSRQPPGAPVPGNTADHGVASETFTSEILLPLLGEPQASRIAVLYSGKGYAQETGADTQTVELRAPSVGRVFAERWLNADALLPADDHLRSDVVAKHSQAEVLTLIRELRNLQQVTAVQSEEGKRTQAGVSHPAVSHIGVRVTWYDLGTVPLETTPPVRLPLVHLRSRAEWLRDEGVKLNIEQVQSDDASLRTVIANAGERTITLKIPRHLRARVELLSFIPAKYVDGGLQSRFNTSAIAGQNGPYVDANDGSYVTRTPPSFWVESLPEVRDDAEAFALPSNALELTYPEYPADPAVMSVRLGSAAVDAGSIRGFAVEQKRWQWPGYAVPFPRSDDMAEWLHLYAGAQDSMPELPGGSFTSHFNATWLLKAALMRPVPLPAQRAANHMGLIVTPIPRFARLMKNKVRTNCVPVHLFATVKATPRDGATRLQPPVWMEAIPLPHSKEVSAGSSANAVPGNLAVFRDPVYDTADTSLLGGIAEKLELDVPSTWEQRLEVGVNPIFHPAPQGGNPPWVTLDLPFGLSYDSVIGGRPAQTAAVMRVHDSQGKWVLAKCRVRRLIDPELVSGSELASNANIAPLGLRLVEDGWIPQDIAIYCATPLNYIKFADYQLNLPPFPKSFPAVYLVTWHRDRWGQALPTWRPLVKVYETDADTRVWHPLEGSEGRLVGPTDYQPVGPGEIQFELSATATVRRLDASDYTESRWLTFIGSFGIAKPASPSTLEVIRNGSAFRLQVKSGVIGAEMPRVQKAGSPSTTLLLLFIPRRDLMRGELERDGGELVGVYAMRQAPGPGAVRADFDLPLWSAQTDGPYKAILIQLQRHNVDNDSEWTMDEGEWQTMVDTMMFPAQPENGRGKEASLRLLPEFIGEFEVT